MILNNGQSSLFNFGVKKIKNFRNRKKKEDTSPNFSFLQLSYYNIIFMAIFL